MVIASSNRRFHQLLRICILALVALTLTSCGLGSNDNDSDDSQSGSGSQTAEAIQDTENTEGTTGENASTGDSEGEGGGGIISRVKRVPGAAVDGVQTAGGWVWDGVSWVWNRGSDGASSIWDVIRSSGGWFWNNVKALPEVAGNAISGFFSWIRGTTVGEILIDIVVSIPEVIAAINPAHWIDKVFGFVLGILWSLVKLAVAVFLILFVVFGFKQWRIWLRGADKAWGPLGRVVAAGEARSEELPVNSTNRVNSLTIDPPMTKVSPPISEQVKTPDYDFERGWTPGQVVELRNNHSNATIDTLIHMLGERAGLEVNFEELTRVTGLSESQTRKHFQSFTEGCQDVSGRRTTLIDTLASTDGVSRCAYSVQQQYLDWWFEE